jgi:glycosyltransferase involved in cell wall biosynthesis
MRRLRPQVVHAHWLPSFGWVAARARARPLVVSAWGSDVYRVSGLVRRRSAVALRGADLVFADSQDLLDAARTLAGRPVRGQVVRWGVDVDVFSPVDDAERRRIRTRLGLSDAGPVVLAMRSLEPFEIYNTPTILRAFAGLRRRRPGATLVLKHPRTVPPPAVIEAVHALGIADGVRIVGNVPLGELPDWYRAADVCVSVPASDSSPISVWEALACGRPCVVSDLPWARTELRDGEDALVVPVDPAAVEAAVLEATSAPAFERLSAAGRRAACDRMDQRAHMDTVDHLYRKLAR